MAGSCSFLKRFSHKQGTHRSRSAESRSTDPFTRHPVTDCVNGAGTVAMGNDTRIGHPDAKRILAFLHIARIDA